MNPVWLTILIGLSGLAVHTLLGFFFAGRVIGQYEERIKTIKKEFEDKAEDLEQKSRDIQRVFVDKAAEQDRIIDRLRDKIEDLMKIVANHDGRLNRRGA
jgi:hypothetical protein